MKNTVWLPLSLLLLVFSCKPEHEEDTLFSLLPPSYSRIDFTNQLTETEDFNMIEYLYFNNGGGVAAGDMNNDGRIDLYFTSNQGDNALFLNKGDLQFEDITEQAGVAGEGNWSTGVTMADVNGDGWLDIYVCQVGNYKILNGRNQLFINQGDLTFKEEAREYGLDFQGFSTQAAFFDYDLDGDLDMYLLNHSVHTTGSYGSSDLRNSHDELAGDRLYRNEQSEGKRRFSDVTGESGIYSSQIGYGLGVNVSDINNDGYPDIYVSNDFHENDYLYINNGDATYSEKLTEMMGHTSRSSMGNDVGDINNDGFLDVVVLDMLPDEQKILKQSGGEDDPELFELKLNYGYAHQFVRNTLQLNLGDGMFSEIGRMAGIYATDWSWSPLFCDVDNDGWKDLFITNGIYRRANDLDYVQFLTGGNRFFPVKDNTGLSDKELYEKMPLHPNLNYLYKNNGDLTFSNKSTAWGFETRSFSNGSTYADLDNDGDLDLVVNNINAPAHLYENNSSTLLNHHYLSVEMKGKGLNSRGVGARVTLYCNGKHFVAEQFSTRGFLSATSDVLHFGLGSVNRIDSLVIRWPDLSEQIIVNVPLDEMITLEMGSGTPSSFRVSPIHRKTTLFSPVRIPGAEFLHREDSYRDIDREFLIPHNLSEEGPALAVGDVNGDGLEDLFVGGASGQASRLFIQEKNGSFTLLEVPQLVKEGFTEDIDAAFFDADGDGDLDLYTVKGGNEMPEGNPLLADRLLINHGNGRFEKSEKGALPYLPYNGSCVRPKDMDGDGDLDLFVGSRSIPGAYGLSPHHILLENDGKGHFTDVTETRAGSLQEAGMVTDACWIDYDMDGDHDLVVVGEWMNITLYNNVDGHFTNVTSDAGLEGTSGWWSSIEVADMDQDGDPDLIAGNYGENSILKASSQEPVELYLNDFDNNGSLDQVICSYHNGVSYPVASLDELVRQIPGIKKEYPTYTRFGGKSAADIFGSKELDLSVTKKAELFQSCLLQNQGNGTFVIISLPRIVQSSPVRDLLVRDVDHNGHPDLLMIGNNYSARPSLGRQDASYGWSIMGDSGVQLNPLTPSESGFKILGDARKIRALTVSGIPTIVIAVNSGELQFIQIL